LHLPRGTGAASGGGGFEKNLTASDVSRMSEEELDRLAETLS